MVKHGINLGSQHYNAGQISQIAYNLGLKDISESKVRTHATNTGLLKKVEINSKPMHLIQESDVPYIIRDLTGREFRLEEIQSEATNLGYRHKSN